MTSPNKRWRELARKISQDAQAQAWNDTPGDLSKIIEMITEAIATAVEEEKFSDVHSCHDDCQRAVCVRIREMIAKAVAEERARMQIIWPSEEEIINASHFRIVNPEIAPEFAKVMMSMKKAEWLDCVNWLRAQAKIGEK